MRMFIALALFVVFSQVTLAGEWLSLGNGGGYAGIPPRTNDGPFFLVDPTFTCPAGSLGPLQPGFREQIRLDHYGPDGCSGSTCRNAVYARQSACGGPVAYIEKNFWDKSRVYKMDGASGIQSYGFNLMTFENHLYVKQSVLPNPEDLPAWKEAWCHSVDDRGPASFEILVESPDHGTKTTAFVYYERKSGALGAFELMFLSNEPVQRLRRTGEVSYKGKHLRLSIKQNGAAPLFDGQLDLQVEGKPFSVPVTCFVPEP